MTEVLPAWGTLSIAEQALMRRAISGYGLSGMVQLRSGGAPSAPAQRRAAP
jgi:hypothetical protein